MNMIEFRITSDLQELRKQSISANFDETKAWLTENLEPLRTMAVTPESMSQCKQYRASIRKVRDRIDESRKLAKAAAMEAYSDFEAKCKELTALCDEAANALDVQIKAMENAVKEEKRLRLMDYFAKTVGDMAEWITFDDCFNPKWLNATYAESTAQADMCAAIDRCRADLNAIRALGSEFETELLAEYRTTRNIGAVLMKNNTLTQLKAEEDERKRRESEAKKEQRFKMYAMPPEMYGQQAETGSVNELVDEDGQELADAPSVADVIRSTEREAFEQATVQEPEYKVAFLAISTARKLDGLRDYMQANGIRFMPVPKE
jgi:hypothetical protein|nr:MAG TPA_asm: Protein of unknown function (DUF1351) [Caudoviricetes sp.]